MLKTRVIPVMLWKDGGLVKGKKFDHSRSVGAVLPAIKVYNARDVDELVLLDVAASTHEYSPRSAEIEWFSRECNVPLAVGGGIRNESDIEQVLRAGADKVVLNSACYETPELIARAANRFGSQCVVVAIDYRLHGGISRCYSYAGTKKHDLSAEEWARQAARLGAGEILLTNCDRDGTMEGYDVLTTARVAETVTIPVIVSGGAGDLKHFLEGIVTGHADAVAAGSIFHFTEITPRAIKDYLTSFDIPIRQGVPRQ